MAFPHMTSDFSIHQQKLNSIKTNTLNLNLKHAVKFDDRIVTIQKQKGRFYQTATEKFGRLLTKDRLAGYFILH